MKYLFAFIILLHLSSTVVSRSYASPLVEAKRSEADKLTQLIQTHEKYYLNLSPFNQPKLAGNNEKLPDLSPLNLQVQYKQGLNIYLQLTQLDRKNLSQENQINLSVLLYSLKNQLDSYSHYEHYMPLTAESGFHVWISDIAKRVDFKTVPDYQAYLLRLAALPKYFSQQRYWMKLGIKAGITQPQVVLDGFEQSIAAYIKEDVTESVYYQPFKKMSIFISDKQKLKLQQEAKKLLIEKVMPTYQRYYNFMINEYKPSARHNIAASSLPNGEKYYQNRLVHYTTLPMSAEQVHQQGIAEVKRIRAEMNEIIAQVKFDGSFSDFVHFLRTDPQFYASTPKALLKKRRILQKEWIRSYLSYLKLYQEYLMG